MSTPPRSPITELGAEIRRLRQEKGWKQPYFAEKLSRDVPTISRWEVGTRKPQPADLIAIARVLCAEGEEEATTLYYRLLTLAGWGEADLIAALRAKGQTRSILTHRYTTVTTEAAVAAEAIDSLADAALRRAVLEKLLAAIAASQPAS